MTTHQDDIVIAVMGGTGTGKSSFIQLLSGDPTVTVGGGIDSETSDIQIVPFHDPESGRRVTIVDTPGFDDSRDGITDTDILKSIAEFLVEEYDQKRKLNGLIYFSRISDPRFGGQSHRNLKMFRNLCGSDAYANVVVLTTFWDRTSVTEGEGRESQLKIRVFKDLVGGGARFMRHNRTLESAREVLRHVLTLVPTNVLLPIEMCDDGMALEDTSAGSVRREEVKQLIAWHNEEMKELEKQLETVKQNNSALQQDLKEEQERIKRKLARWKTESDDLKRGLNNAQMRLLEANTARERKRQELDRSIRDLQSQFRQDMAAMKETHSQQLLEVVENWRAGQERLQQENSELLSALKEEHARLKQALQAQHEAKITAIERQHNQKQQAAKQEGYRSSPLLLANQ